ncbi:MAG: type IV toxin-antitoxin system AbiEi family antitoxin domain-containing protein [Candidatus Woesearchaeota archaeon]
MNKIYKEFYQNKLFTLAEANKIIKDYQICRNNINRLAKQGLITRIKAGIYYINPLDDKEFYPDPIHIASKLRSDAIITANSALQVLNITNQTDTTIYIGAKHAAKLRIGKYTYRIIKGQNFGIDKIRYKTRYGEFEIKTADLERTIIECLKARSMKGEELIKTFKSRPIEISIRKIINYLEKYNMPILYSKAGLILEACKTQLKIDESDLDKIRKKLSKKIYYFKERGIRLVRPRYKYYKEWNIMLPETLYELMIAGRIPKTGVV